jgi:non-SMC mitotic condensation complex subunit 1
VLEFVSHFQPSTKEEVYDIMNALDDRLSTPNSAVVLATVKVFLNLTLAMPYDHQQVTAAATVHHHLGLHSPLTDEPGHTSASTDSFVVVQVLERIKDPLVTLISRDQYETAYAVLAHFLVIAQRAPIIFASVSADQHWRWRCAVTCLPSLTMQISCSLCSHLDLVPACCRSTSPSTAA